MDKLFNAYGTERIARGKDASGRPIGSKPCSRCGGSGIFHPYGVCFKCLGSGKGGTERLYSAPEVAKLASARGKRADAKLAKFKAAADAKHAVKAAGYADWIAVNGPAVESAMANLSALVRGGNESEASLPPYAARFKEAINAGEPVSDRMLDVVLSSIIAKLALKDAAASSVYVGEIGKRAVLTITVEKAINLGAFAYHGPCSYLYLCRDAAGNRIVYKGTAALASEGESVTVKCSIKGHEDYKGEKQTVIARPVALAEMAEAA